MRKNIKYTGAADEAHSIIGRGRRAHDIFYILKKNIKDTYTGIHQRKPMSTNTNNVSHDDSGDSSDEYEWQQVRVKKGAGRTPSGGKPDGGKPVGGRPAEEKPGGGKPVGEKHSDSQRSAEKADGKPPQVEPEFDEIEERCLKNNECVGRPLNLKY